MSDMECPFCQQKLEIGGVDGILRGCPKCRNLGTEILWQELVRTRKALDIAVDALKKIGFGCGIPPDENYAYNYINIAADAHQQIQELEQKDK